ncbi:helix-turn-helix domain-containing protein [Nocardia sp. NPDC004750]
MSWQACHWAARIAKTGSGTEKCVLMIMAETADDDGRAVFLSQETLAERTGFNERTIRRSLLSLEQQGLIRRGDQSLVEGIAPRHRPVVWDLVMTESPSQIRGDSLSERGDFVSIRGDSVSEARGLSVLSEGTLCPERGDTVPPKASLEASLEASKEAGPRKRGARERGTRLPDNWMPGEETIAWARREHPSVDLRIEHQKFCNHWRAKTGKDATKCDWNATWRNWIIREAQYASQRGRGHRRDQIIANAERYKNNSNGDAVRPNGFGPQPGMFAIPGGKS